MPHAAILAALAISMLFASGCNRTRPPETVLLITIDTLRADHLSVYGYGRPTSPMLDRFAERATLFESAYAQAPCTKPSLWNILTGMYKAPIPIPDEILTLSDYLKGRGFRTGAIVAQRKLRNGGANIAQGFDHYEARAHARADAVTSDAIVWLEEQRGERSFLWLHYFDPHDPYRPPERYRGVFTSGEDFDRDRRRDGIHFAKNEPKPKNAGISREHREFLIAAYDEEIRFLDDELGRLFDFLDESGLGERALVLLTADHGEELDDNGSRWDHCQLLSPEEIRVPLVVRLPGQERGRRVPDAVQTIDLFPTVVDVVAPEDAAELPETVVGRSLAPLLQGAAMPSPTFALSAWAKQVTVISEGTQYTRGRGFESLRDASTQEELEDPARLVLLRETVDRELGRDDRYYRRIMRQLREIGYIE